MNVQELFWGGGWMGGWVRGVGVWHKGDNQMLVKNCKVYFLYLMRFFWKGNNILFYILMGEKRGVGGGGGQWQLSW